MESMQHLPEWEERQLQTDLGWQRVQVVLEPQKERAQLHQTDFLPPPPEEQLGAALVEERSPWLPFPRDQTLVAVVVEEVPEQRQERPSSMEVRRQRQEPVAVLVLHTCQRGTEK